MVSEYIEKMTLMTSRDGELGPGGCR